MYKITAACFCNTGLIRQNNEDNFYFNKAYLKADNHGLDEPLTMGTDSDHPVIMAVFDGMGGENDGEEAAHEAAKALALETAKERRLLEADTLRFLADCALRLNEAVVRRSQQLKSPYMGSTMAALCINKDKAYVCNLGDSRAYVLRDGRLLQLSEDHIDTTAYQRGRTKAPLTQNLGIDPEEYLIEPYTAEWQLCSGDRFLLCSDGVTDMVSNECLAGIMSGEGSDEDMVRAITEEALQNGGRDNITAIVCSCSLEDLSR